ncbi:ATP synthase F0 subunit B [Patescibacteria group bacterium]|jgi:F-type H+-transporting ATPase subunit b|nr:ATP synthase F0 subunit B [Patescibacteria group bacterium]
MDALARLGIDGWSVLLYLVNFGLLAAVLTKFLYKPALKFMDDRREQIRRSIEESEELKRRFEEETKRREQEARLMSSEMQHEMKSAREQAESRAKQLVTEAERNREEMLNEAQTQIGEMKKNIRKEAEADVLKRIEAVTLAVLRDKVPQDVVRDSVKDAWSALPEA